MKIEVIQGDITTMDVDVIVNAANSTLLGGGGVDGAIHRSAGPELKTACAKLNGCQTGDAKITPGFQLKAKYIIHTVGPVWKQHGGTEEALLASCYQKSLDLAENYSLRTIAFPAISTGVYGFPIKAACNIALNTLINHQKKGNFLEKAYLVMFSDADYLIMKGAMDEKGL